MTIAKFYSSIIGSRRTAVPTFQESRHDYRRAREAQTAGMFAVAEHLRASAALHTGFGGN